MKNFNVYDPMKKGMGLLLDGQTLAHIEVCFQISVLSPHVLKKYLRSLSLGFAQ
jgi:hypothetical protein